MPQAISAANANPEIVAFSQTDKENPKNWSKNRKRITTFWTSALVFVAFFGSGVYAPAEVQVRQKYGVSADVASLGLTVYVLGFAFGPLLWGPMGELYGRKPPFLIAWPVLIGSLALSAWVSNLPVIFMFRFVSGICGSAPLTNGGAITADLYAIVDPAGHAISISYFALAAFSAPVFGPMIGSFIAFRAPEQLWVLRVQFFFSILAYPIVFLFQETHAPTILAVRSRKLRKEGNPRAWAHHELRPRSVIQVIKTDWVRPTTMLIKEPIVMGAAVWTSLAYAILFFSFESYPVIFIEQHDFSPELGGLPFLALGLGMLFAVIPYIHLLRFFSKLQLPKWVGAPSDPRAPESTLKLALFSCVCLTVSMFWLAWTSGRETHWIAATLSGIPFGFAIVTIFITFLTYSAQTYTVYSASAGASNVLARSVLAAIFPVVAHSILDTIGTEWGVSLFGFISIGLLLIPLIFLKYGKRLRDRSHYAQEATEIMRKTLQARAEAAKKLQQAGASGGGQKTAAVDSTASEGTVAATHPEPKAS